MCDFIRRIKTHRTRGCFVKKMHYIVLGILLTVAITSFKKNMFVWMTLGRYHVQGEIRGGGLKFTFRDVSFESWSCNVGWYNWALYWFGGYDRYYLGWPEYPTGSDWAQWRFCGFQLATDRRGGPGGTIENVDVIVPLWLLAVVYFGLVGWHNFRQHQLLISGRCLRCKHILVGQRICPECGTPFQSSSRVASIPFAER